MGRLFVLFFLLPWWAYVPASIGVLWVGERVYERALETQAEKVAALETAAPEPVDLGEFNRDRDIHAADEVFVVGMIDHELDYELVERTNGVPTSTRYLYMIFGSDGPESKVVRAALMLDKREEAEFLDGKADEWSIGARDNGWVYALNGFAETSTTLDEMADGAIEERGLTKAEDFIFIEPFFAGREVALAPRGIPEQSRYIGWAIAAVVALIGVVKRVTSVRARLVDDDEEPLNQDEPETYTPALVATQTFTVPEGVSEDTPLGRLARRNTGSTAPTFDPEPANASFDDPDPEAILDTLVPDADTLDTQPAGALAHDIDATLAHDAESRFAPVGDIEDVGDVGDTPAPAQQSSALVYYAKLGLAMLVVGGIAYDPSLINAALPVGAIALFWFGAYVVVGKRRRVRAQSFGGADTAPRHSRRPDGAAQPAVVGVGGHSIDLTAPVRSSRRERGVI